MLKIEKRLSEHSLSILVLVLLVALAAIVVVVCYYPYSLANFPPATEAGTVAIWGQFGDYFGGTLNPIFGFLSVIALLIALVIQGRELKVSSKAIAQQRFEQTLFSWIASYREMLGSIVFMDGHNQIAGRSAMYQIWKNRLGNDAISTYAKAEHGRHRDTSVDPERPASDNEVLEHLRAMDSEPAGLSISFASKSTDHEIERAIYEQKVVQIIWRDLYRFNEYQLDCVFGNLCTLLKWIDSSEPSFLSEEQKQFYVQIVRSQISPIEQKYLFLHGLTKRGERFKKFAEKYTMFDESIKSDPVISYLMMVTPESIGYTEKAFDADNVGS